MDNNRNATGLGRLGQFAALLLLPLLAFSVSADQATMDQHQLGERYSPLQQINKDNVHNLVKAWEFRTGDMPPEDIDTGTEGSLISFQDQPTLIEGNLVICSVSRQLFALDPATGEQRWTFDPEDGRFGMQKCRGVANWTDPEAEQGAACKSRILFGTADNRLIAIDARNGKPCEDFGDNGQAEIPISKPEIFPGEVQATSRPAVVNDVVITGSAVADNQRVDAPSGRVTAFHARTGELLWKWDPVPRDPDDPAMETWEKGTDNHGAGNVWSSMSVDHERDLVFLPTSTPSGDFYGGGRPGDNLYTNSVVALRGATGEVVWHFQTVYHDIWDYDLPAQPMLIDLPHEGEMVPALVQNTKMGMIFMFNRETGEPLTPIEQRPVPQEGAVEGEVLSPTQPFPVGMPKLMPHEFGPDDAWGFTPIDRWMCRRTIRQYKYGSIYTPPSEQGTIIQPAMGGGPNWGSGGYDPESHIMVVPSNRVPMIMQLVPREDADPRVEESTMLEVDGGFMFPNRNAPYVPKVKPLLSPLGAPCSKPPWAALTAVDLVNREIVWEVPLGSLAQMLPFSVPFNLELGNPGAGGPLVTAGGLVFIGYTSIDNQFRAFDLHTGKVLWQHDLPAAGTAVPVTYEVDGEQYVVIPAGGHSMYETTMGDSVVAFKLKRED
jgi:quinoprotein glucose dehydrogenase